MEYIKSKVETVTFKVAPNGKLIAIAVLEDKKEFEGNHAILFDNARELRDRKIGKGAKLKIRLGDPIDPIKEVLQVAKFPTYTSNCPSCGEKLSSLKDHDQCTNIFCTGISQSHFYRLFYIMSPEMDQFYVSLLLNEYALSNTEKLQISNMVDFKNCYLNIQARNTKTRLEHWVSHHGNVRGEILFNLDQQLAKELSKTEYEKDKFWLVANLPIENELFDMFRNINPADMLYGADRVFRELSSGEMAKIMDNYDFLKMLLDVFEHFSGEKKWI